MTREAAFSALFAAVSAAYPWGQASRRMKLWSEVPAALRPAFFQLESGPETYQWASPATPKRTLEAKLFLYFDARDPTTPGATAINNALDAIDAALAPAGSDLSLGRQTLGGTVLRLQGRGRAGARHGRPRRRRPRGGRRAAGGAVRGRVTRLGQRSQVMKVFEKRRSGFVLGTAPLDRLITRLRRQEGRDRHRRERHPFCRVRATIGRSRHGRVLRRSKTTRRGRARLAAACFARRLRADPSPRPLSRMGEAEFSLNGVHPHVRIRLGRADRHAGRRLADQFRPRAGSVAQRRRDHQGALWAVQLSRRHRLGHQEDDRQGEDGARLAAKRWARSFSACRRSPASRRPSSARRQSSRALRPIPIRRSITRPSSPIRASSTQAPPCR